LGSKLQKNLNNLEIRKIEKRKEMEKEKEKRRRPGGPNRPRSQFSPWPTRSQTRKGISYPSFSR
jgi:hypothetical protein